MEKGEGVPQEDDQNIPSLYIPSEHPLRWRRFPKLPSTVFKGEGHLIFSPIKASFGPYQVEQRVEEGQANWYVHCWEGTDKPMECLLDALAPIIDVLWSAYDTSLLDPNPNAWYQAIANRYDRGGRCIKGEEKYTSENSLRTIMMIVEGSYILEIMLATRNGVTSKFFSSEEIDTYRRDLLLLENQIPLKVLEVLASILYHPQPQPEEFVKNLILEFFSLPPILASKWSESLHMLDIYRVGLLREESTFVMEDAHAIDIKTPKHLNFYIPSATELHDASIGIKASSTQRLIMDILFCHQTLTLPVIDIDDMAKSNFHNLIWLERLDSHLSKQFSSYVCFMNRLLKRAEDSSLLQSLGIINTTLSDDEVVDLFNNLRKNIGSSAGAIMEARLWDNIGPRLRERYNMNSEVWRKDLFQNYLRSPWAVISVFVALLIFSLSIIQTVYTILTYYNGK